jgi:hypothetical protein
MINTELNELLQQKLREQEIYCDDTTYAQTAQICRHVLRMPDVSATDDWREGAPGRFVCDKNEFV